jgi:DNA-binding beta-propeller fold protein YncE
MGKLSLLPLLLLLNLGCTAIDRMSGVAEVKELQQTGTPAKALILRIWDTGMTVNDDPVIGMEVEVHPAEGEVWNATIPKSLVSRIDIPRFQPGQTVTVRFDPRDRSRVGLDEYRYR